MDKIRDNVDLSIIGIIPGDMEEKKTPDELLNDIRKKKEKEKKEKPKKSIKKSDNLTVLLVKAKALADKYAATKKRWWVLDENGKKTGVLKTSNEEADKKSYEEFCKGYEVYFK